MDAAQRLALIERWIKAALSAAGLALLAGGVWFGRYDMAAVGGVLHLIYRRK